MASSSFRSSSRAADGRESSLSVQGETMGRATPSEHINKSYRYRVVSHESSVDETLFGSQRDRTRIMGDRDSDSPARGSSQPGQKRSPAIKPQLSAMPRTRNKYRIVKHTPTYVDQSLFGGPLQEPTFEAPWTDKKEERRRNNPTMWAPPVEGSLDFEARAGSAFGDRPSSAGRPRSMSGGRPGSSAGGSRPGSASGSRPGSVNKNHRRTSSGNRPLSASGRRSATPNKPPPWK